MYTVYVDVCIKIIPMVNYFWRIPAWRLIAYILELTDALVRGKYSHMEVLIRVGWSTPGHLPPTPVFFYSSLYFRLCHME
jgi:hypothetical protein